MKKWIMAKRNVVGLVFLAGCSPSDANTPDGGVSVDATSPSEASPGFGAGPFDSSVGGNLGTGCGDAQPPPAPTSNCPQSLCGNGVIDSCNPGQQNANSEQCDGLDLDGATCASLGYAGGPLRCSSVCLFDDSRCETCTNDPRVKACHHYAQGGAGALATNGSEIALAWVEDAPGYPFHFTRFAADLTLLSDTPCLGDATYGVSLAATGSGWMVAAASSSGTLAILSLDAQGTVQSTAQLGTPVDAGSLTIIPYWGPKLVAGPSGGFLLGWFAWSPTDSNHSSLELQLLDATGSPSGTSQAVDKVLDWASAAVDDGFVIAANRFYESPSYALETRHLGLDGTLTTGATIPIDQSEWGVSLAWSGTTLWMTYNTVTSGLYGQDETLLQQATQDGALIGSPFPIAPVDSIHSPNSNVSLLAVGADAIVLVALGANYLGGLGLERWTTGPAAIWPEATIAEAWRMGSAQLVLQGGDAVVAWSDLSLREPSFPRLTLARVRITP